VAEDRFRQARFVPVGGSTVVVSAADLRRARGASKMRSALLGSLHIDVEKGKFNDQPVHLQIEV
jgi:hypothetical protein